MWFQSPRLWGGSQALGYGGPQALGYGGPQALGYGGPQALGYGGPQALGYGGPQALGYGGPQALGNWCQDLGEVKDVLISISEHLQQADQCSGVHSSSLEV